jgi:hypothetical protein
MRRELIILGGAASRAASGATRFYWDCLLDEAGLVEPKPGEWIVFARTSVPQAATAFKREVASYAIRFAARPEDEELCEVVARLKRMSVKITFTCTPPLTAKLGEIAGTGHGNAP